VSYRDAGGDADDGDGDAENDEGGGKKAKTGNTGGGYAMGNKEYDGNGVLGGMGRLCMRKFPVFKVKDKAAVFGKR
jgi:DNA repair and recombination RAD54-like protein